MKIDYILDRFNLKISGLNTIVLEKDNSNKNIIYAYLTTYPKGERMLLCTLKKKGIIDFLFDILISGKYKEWDNYDLIENEFKDIEDNFLRNKNSEYNISNK
jgi:hypothetical protein